MPEQKSYTTDEVFGVGRDLPLNYVFRPEVDEKFIDSLAREKHIVIYGSSKQGKTSLRKKCLEEGDSIIVACQNTYSLAELHSSILKVAGFTVRQSTEKTVSGANKIIAGLDGKAQIPLIGGISARGGYENNREETTKETFTPLELDPNDPNDIIRALAEIKFTKFIVLEDFHYLPDETQRNFSFSLKTFHENSKLTFIIVGVWREENRLIAFNGDLTERVLSVDVDTWKPDSLRQVIRAGGDLLKVKFSERFVEELMQKCFDSVHIVQESCRRACRAQDVTKTALDWITIGEDQDVSALVSQVVSDQAGRYRGFLMGFADGFQETDLQMPRWITYAILCSDVDSLEKGIRLRRISRIIKLKHPRGEGLNNGNITQVLKTASSLQNKKGTRPLVVDYDTSNTSLNVVDKGFLIWLSTQNVKELLDELDLPEPVAPEDIV